MLLSEGRMDRRTDMTKLIAANRNFVNVPKNVKLYKKSKRLFKTMQEVDKFLWYGITTHF